MTKKIIIALSCLATIAGLWSCVKNPVDRGSVKSAIQVVTSDLGTTWVTVALEPYGEAVSSYVVVDPVPASTIPYLDMDAVQKLNYLNEHGVQVQAPYRKSFTGFKPGETYVIGYLGKKADGTVCSAPTFSTFEMGTAKADCSLSMTEESATSYAYNYSVKKNEFAAKYKYILSTDESITALTPEEFEAKVKAEGTESTNDLSGELKSADWIACVLGAVAYDKNGVAGAFSMKSVEGKDVDDLSINVPTESEKGIWSTTIDVKKKSAITVKVGNGAYGFLRYSGNGGVGELNNPYSAAPYYNMTPTYTYVFSVEKSVGRMALLGPAAEAGTGEKFWVNAGVCQVKFTYDGTNSDNIPRYRIELVNNDANRVFYEGFDLFVYGGFYQAPVAGSGNPLSQNKDNGQIDKAQVPDVDGTEPGIKGKTKATINGIVPLTYGKDVPLDERDGQPNETYIKNRDMGGWQLKRISEFPGFIQLGNSQGSHFDAYFVTPKLSKLDAPTNVIVETAATRFAGEGDIVISILNAGTINKVEVTQASTACSSGDKVAEGIYDPTTSTTFVLTNAILPKAWKAGHIDHDNNATNKPIAKLKIFVTGATGETQIKCAVADDVTGKEGRCQFDYINVYKQ